MSYIGAENGIDVMVFSRYTSDKENHPASPHNHYVCVEYSGNHIKCVHDVYEGELK